MKPNDPLRHELTDGPDTPLIKQLHLWGAFTSHKVLRVPDWSVLWHRDFRLLWAAGGVSNACRWMEVAVLGLLLRMIQPWHVFLGTFILGCGTILDLPSRRSLIYDLVGPQHLVTAMSLETVSNTLGKFFGPLLGGLAIELSGFRGMYLLLLLAYLLAIALIVQVKAAVARPLMRALPVWQSLASGIQYVVR